MPLPARAPTRPLLQPENSTLLLPGLILMNSR